MRWWQSSPAEGSAVPRATFQGCSRSFLVWSLRWCQGQPPPFLIHSRGPETPAIPHAVPEAPKPAAGDGHPATGATSPRAATVPPSPPRLGQPGGDLLWASPAQSRRSPRGGDLGKPGAPGGRAAKRSGRCHTRQQSSHSAECHTTDGDMQRDTAQSDRPTAQPDAEVSEAPARADTFAHLETAGLRGSNLEIFSGYVRAAENTSLNQGWVFNNLLFGAFLSLF